jgi:hypothetical protein
MALAIALAVSPGTTAEAQMAGTYSGTSSDGASITMSVTGTGPFKLGNASVNFQAKCKVDSSIANEGWGFFLGNTIVASGTDFQSSNDYYFISGTLHFPNNNTIKGTINSRTAVFVPGTTPPTAAKFCRTGDQSFTLKFQTSAQPQSFGGSVVLSPSDH